MDILYFLWILPTVMGVEGKSYFLETHVCMFPLNYHEVDELINCLGMLIIQLVRYNF